ncbi:MAG TPA: helix-turn-helix transcriptional regulator [Pyrinomonadaceae bacterium]|jgi:transcriptional regulator with XRE-family HTH domain
MVRRKLSLGEFLKAAREGKGLTLRAVERETDISNAYLSQLESDKIQQPSPLKLHKLCELYAVSYPAALELAGYPVPDHQGIAAEQAGLAARIGPVTDEEENALVEYLAFLRSRQRR